MSHQIPSGEIDKPRSFAFGEAGQMDDDFSAEGRMEAEQDILLTTVLKDKLWSILRALQGSDVFARGGGALIKFHESAQLIGLFASPTDVYVIKPKESAGRIAARLEPIVLQNVEIKVTHPRDESTEGNPEDLGSGLDAVANTDSSLGTVAIDNHSLRLEIVGKLEDESVVSYCFDPSQHEIMTTVDKFFKGQTPRENEDDAIADSPLQLFDVRTKTTIGHDEHSRPFITYEVG